jgi:hypothetical protein
LASLRHKLLAGVLAERRGHLAPNFMDHAEKSSMSMHSMAPSATGSSHSHSLTQGQLGQSGQSEQSGQGQIHGGFNGESESGSGGGANSCIAMR